MDQIFLKIGICGVAFVVLWVLFKTLKLILKLAVIGLIVFLIWYFFSPIEEFVKGILNI